MNSPMALTSPRPLHRPPVRPVLSGAERSIDAFERIHGLSVTVQDHMGRLSPFLNPSRLRPPNPSSVEISIFQDDKLCWVISAGPPSPKLPSAARSKPIGPPTIDSDRIAMIAEHLRQLAARLQLWLEETKPLRPDDDFTGGRSRSTTVSARQSAIFRFIDEHYAQRVTLAMLARQLQLSEGRGSHVVRQCCRESFRTLLLQKRLKVAMELLRQSGLTVSEVASASGFESVAHFHRLFRRRVGHTPAEHRIDGPV